MQHLDEGLLQAWLDHPRSGLEPSEVADIRSHLASCEACARELEVLRGSGVEAHSLLAAGVDRSVPRPPFEEVVRRARGQDELRRARRRLSRMAWAASLVVALGVGWWSNDLYRQARMAEAERAPAAVPARLLEAPAPEAEAAAIEPQVGASTVPTGRAEEAAQRSDPEATAELRDQAGFADTQPAPEPSVATREFARAGAQAAAPSAPPADDRVVVSGIVRNERGEPVTSAQVYVAGLDVGVLTQQDGSYTLLVPPADTVLDLTVARIGYRTEKQAFDGRPGSTVVADFDLHEEALQLQEIIVAGAVGGVQRRALGNAITRVDARPEWSSVTLEAAEAVLDRGLVTLPAAAVLSIDLAGTLVRVRQDLGDAVVLTLVQGHGNEGVETWPIESAGTVASRQVDDLLVTATAPLGDDSLQVLLDQVR